MCWKVCFQSLSDTIFHLIGTNDFEFRLCCGQVVFKILKIHFLCGFVSIFATNYRFNTFKCFTSYLN